MRATSGDDPFFDESATRASATRTSQRPRAEEIPNVLIDLTRLRPVIEVEASTAAVGVVRQPWLGAAADAVLVRALDIVVAFTMLVVLSPLFVVVAIVVAATSPGGALYRQERCGRNGRPFMVLKFRTMVAGADRLAEDLAADDSRERTDAPAFKSPEDPRVTPIGRLLRRTNIDELPQLLNILVGHMALVGPRPLVWSEAEVLDGPVLDARHAVRPGLTGSWQIERTADTSFAERIAMDVHYARTRSVATDLGILVRTPISVIRGVGSF